VDLAGREEKIIFWREDSILENRMGKPQISIQAAEQDTEVEVFWRIFLQTECT
jgi:hypothetical protein